jgi:single-strand DNA-binding protein
MRTTVTFEGNLADDPRVRFPPSGKQVTDLTVLVNARRQTSDGEWVDGEPTRYVVLAFKTLAVNIVESLAKGDRVFVHGTVTTEAWTDQQSGERRTAQRVLAEVVGPSLRWATARITKTTRTLTTDETHRATSASTRPDEGPIASREGRPVRSTPGALPSAQGSPDRRVTRFVTRTCDDRWGSRRPVGASVWLVESGGAVCGG